MRHIAILAIIPLLCCSRSNTDLGHVVETRSIHHTEILADLEHLELCIDEIEVLDEKTLILFSRVSGTIHWLNLEDRSLSLVSKVGYGPSNIRTKTYFYSVIDSHLYIHDCSTLVTKVFNTNGFERTFRTDVPIVSSVKLGCLIWAELYVGSNEISGAMLDSEKYLGVFEESSEYSGQWDLIDKKFNAEYSSVEAANILHHFSIRLFKIDDSQFYRIPFWGSKYYELLTVNGNIVGKLVLPISSQERLPEHLSEIRHLSESKIKAFASIRDCIVDSEGSVYFLLSNVSKPGSSTIAKSNTNGEVVQRIEIGRNLKALGLDETKRLIYALDSDSQEILIITPDQYL